MKIEIPGYTEVAGSPAAILKLMQHARMFDAPTEDDYIKVVQQTAWRAFGIGLQVTGDTYAERAESLLREMNKAKMIIIKED